MYFIFYFTKKFIIYKLRCAHHKTIQHNFFLQGPYTAFYVMECISLIAGLTRVLIDLLVHRSSFTSLDGFWIMSYLQHQTSVWCSPGHQANKLCHNVFPVPKTVKERDWLHNHKDITRNTTAMLNEPRQHWGNEKSPPLSIGKGYFNNTKRIKQGFKPILLW